MWKLVVKKTIRFAEDLNEEAEEIMEYVGKAMVGNQVSKLTKGLGLDEDEEKNQGAFYDPKKEEEEDERRQQEKAKRDEGQAKKKAERAVKRNEIRQKYGLKESKTDQALVDNKGRVAKNEEEEGKNSLTRQEDTRYKDAPPKDKEKCSLM